MFYRGTADSPARHHGRHPHCRRDHHRSGHHYRPDWPRRPGPPVHHRLHSAFAHATGGRLRVVDRAGRGGGSGTGRPARNPDAMASRASAMNRQRHWLRPALVALLIGLAIALLATASAGAAESGHVLAALLQWFRDPAQWQGAQGIPLRLAEHVGYVLWSMLMGMAVALPLGIGLGHYGRGGTLAINISNISRAIPAFRLIILVFLRVGFGIVPILVALTALAIPPMVTNSYVGMRSVEPAIRQAARAMGMTAWQTLWRVELPIALPLVMAGIRTSAVQVVSTATLA